jgi:hypothetical protein
MVAMRYQYVDQYLLENTAFFNREGSAFALKPEALRYKPILIPEPPPQTKDYSYDTRVVSTEYYTYNI